MSSSWKRLYGWPVKTLTQTRGRRSRRPLAASLWGLAFAFGPHAAKRTEPELELKERQY